MKIQTRVIQLISLSCVAMSSACGDDGGTPTGTQGGTGDATIASSGTGNASTPTSSPTSSTAGSTAGSATDATDSATSIATSNSTNDTTAPGDTSATDATTQNPGTTGTTDSSGGVLDTTAGTTVDTSGGSSGTTGMGADPIVSVAIVPEDPIVVVKDGVIPPALDFKAIATTEMGQQFEVDGDWSWDRPDAASMNPGNGVFKATGQVGAKDTVGFKFGNLQASTSATVKLWDIIEPAPIDPNTKDKLKGDPQPDPTMKIVYPYDQTVFPRGLTGPTVQWNGTLAQDIFYVHVTSPTYELEWFGVVPPKSRFDFPLKPKSVWPLITASNDGAITTEIKRFSNNVVYATKPQTWYIAPANLAGTVYYWEINNGKVVRLPVGASKPEKFLEEKQSTCIACHSISADGSTLSASYAGGWSPWAAWNIGDGKQKYYSNTASGFTAIAPNGSHIVWGHWSDGAFNTTGRLTLSVFNSTTGLAFLDPPPAGVGGGAPSHPAWSHDSSKVAFAVRTNGNGLDFTASTLWITDVDLMNPAFTNTKKIVDAVANRPTTTFPTFLPDSKWVAFERATQARTRGAAGELYLTDINGDTVLALDSANGSGYLSAAQAATSYEPTFLPVAVGGYAWLVFGSERMYGNTLEDQAVNTRKKQLWVAAINLNPKPGEDPSHPAFWLPGQELNNQNMRGAWALSPCKADGLSCSAGFDCCDGFCYGQPAICHDQPLDNCSQVTEKCDNDADCCGNTNSCIGGFCSLVPN
jgi:hypothetical protein